MPLVPLSDVSPADWFVKSVADPWTKICLGPPGFEAYARVHFNLDPDEQSSDRDVVRRVLAVLALHTTTADDACVGVWKGWGFWPNDFHPKTVCESDVSIPHRDYHLLAGPLADALDAQSLGVLDHWGGAVPHLIWPADHAWFLAADVDPDWLGVGGSQALIDEILAAPGLDAAPSAYDASDWEVR